MDNFGGRLAGGGLAGVAELPPVTPLRVRRLVVSLWSCVVLWLVVGCRGGGGGRATRAGVQ